MTVDKRLVIVLVLLGVSYLAQAVAQRWGAPYPRIRVNRWIAFVAGSRNDQVLWRVLAVQIGLLTFPLWYAIFAVVTEKPSLFLASVLMLVTTAVLQIVGQHQIRKTTRTSPTDGAS